MFFLSFFVDLLENFSGLVLCLSYDSPFLFACIRDDLTVVGLCLLLLLEEFVYVILVFLLHLPPPLFQLLSHRSFLFSQFLKKDLLLDHAQVFLTLPHRVFLLEALLHKQQIGLSKAMRGLE